jgi:2-polyprenyl-3-methyl-5-hydroxy-6-metoxy-1,4-benzoquinol methylase
MTAFDELALFYDLSIDWDQRLQRELPFLRNLVKTKENALILDLACGSGRHVTALAKEYHQVIGLDLSSQMIAAAEKHTQENQVQVEYHIADMVNATSTVEGPFDLIFCLGNSLALLPSIDALQQTLKGVHTLLHDDGYFVSQTLNFDEIRHSQFRFFPLKSGFTTVGEEVIFARFFESITDTPTANLVFTGFIKKGSNWKTVTHNQPILQLSRPIIEQLMRLLHFTKVKMFSTYSLQTFSAQESRNLITLAQK